MLSEITLPDDYTGTLSQENKIIGDINDNFSLIEKEILGLNDSALRFENHIIDFEEYQIDVYFGEEKAKASISIIDGKIQIKIADKTITVDSDGNVA